MACLSTAWLGLSLLPFPLLALTPLGLLGWGLARIIRLGGSLLLHLGLCFCLKLLDQIIAVMPFVYRLQSCSHTVALESAESGSVGLQTLVLYQFKSGVEGTHVT